MSTGLPGHIQGRKPHDHPRRARSIDMYNNDVGKESAQKFMKQTGDLKAATLYFFIGIYYPLTDIVIVHIVYINETNS